MTRAIASHPLRDRLLGAPRPVPEEIHDRRAAEERWRTVVDEWQRTDVATGVSMPSDGYDHTGKATAARRRKVSLTA